MDQQTYIVTCEGTTPADSQCYAEELRDALLNATSDITVQRKRENLLLKISGQPLCSV